MSEQLNDIDKFFVKHIGPLEATPPANVWQNVEAELDKSNVEKYKKRAIFLTRLSAMLLLLLLATGTYEILTKSKGSQQGPSAIPIVANTKDKRAGDTMGLANTTVNTMPADKTTQPPGEYSDAPVPPNKASTGKMLVGNNHKMVVAATIAKPKAGNADNNPAQSAWTELKPAIKNAESFPSITKKFSSPAGKPTLMGDSIANGQNDATGNVAINKNNFGAVIKDSSKAGPLLLVKNKGNNRHNFFKNISLTAYFSPQVDGYGLRDDDDDHFPGGTDDDDRDKIRGREKHSFSYTTGLTANYQLSKNWVVQTGLYLSKASIDVKPTTLYANTDNTGKVQYRYNSSSGYAYILPYFNTSPAVGDSCLAGNSINSLQYVGIPLNIGYAVRVKKLLIQPTVGIGVNILTKSSIETELRKGTEQEEKNITDVKGLRPVYFNITASAEVRYPLLKRVSFSFSPTARLALTSINKNNVVKSFTNSIGAAIGINYEF
jgi:hypothetical protein